MTCYRAGGCGPYENRSCSDCPASKSSYLDRGKNPKNESTKSNSGNQEKD